MICRRLVAISTVLIALPEYPSTKSSGFVHGFHPSAITGRLHKQQRSCACPGRVTSFLYAEDSNEDEENPESEDNSSGKKKGPWQGRLSLTPPSYSDNFLLDFHNKAQEAKQLVTNTLGPWNKNRQEEEIGIQDWKDAFQLNGLADFTPPLTDGLNCLMVGDGSAFGSASNRNRVEDQLPWEDYPGAAITSLPVKLPEEAAKRALLQGASQASAMIPRPTAMASSETQEDETAATAVPMPSDPDNRPAAVYDCIVDQGLMESILATRPSASDPTPTELTRSLQNLVWEASTALKDLGIYVMVTSRAQDDERTRELIEQVSKSAGLDWKWELDGISDENQVVSVARRYCTGSLPPVGKLATSFFRDQ